MNSIEKLIDDIIQMRNKGIIVISLSQIKMNSLENLKRE